MPSSRSARRCSAGGSRGRQAAEQGTVQKTEQRKAQKKDGTGGQMKKGDAK